MKATEIVGKRIIDKDAFEVGKVSDFEVDTEKWIVGNIIISSGVLGSDFTVPINEVDKIGDYLVLKIGMKK